MTIELTLSPAQEQALQTIAEQFNRELERSGAPFPNATTLQQLKTALQEALFVQAGFEAYWKEAKSKHNAEPLCIVHPQTGIRNLPWQLATEENGELPLFKAVSPNLPSYQPSLGNPLKILFMVATPTGVTRLNFEEEEEKLLIALLPLMGKGLVQVHFTNNGSLEDLEEKLLENKFHVLHFSGHGSYRNGKGTLALEAPLTGEFKEADVATLNGLFDRLDKKGHRPDLVVLSACQTAQGESGELSGIADALIQENIPAVVAMSSSIIDDCAAHFTTAFYDFLSQGSSIPDAFQKATKAMRAFEIQRYKPAENRLANGQFLASGQWLIPQLLMSQQVRQLVNKTADKSELVFTFDAAYLQKEANLCNFLQRHPNYVFAGRRKEIQFAFQALEKKKAVLLKGQGGVGKTSLAEHLAIRLIANNQRVKVFTHSEKTPAAQSLLDQMQEYLTKDKQYFSVVSELALVEKLDDKFLHLLECVSTHCDPLFIFDNVETFQVYDQEKSAWIWNIDKHEDVLTVIQILSKISPRYPLIITGRYSVAEFAEWQVCNLNTVPFADFLKKCWQLSFSELSSHLEKDKLPLGTLKNTEQEKTTFKDVMQLLYETLGGNYRALEFFDELYTKEKEGIFVLLGKLTDLKENPKVANEVLHRMSENLVLGQLISYLNEEAKDTLSLLARFCIPVLPMAVGMQREGADHSRALAHLTNLTLVELQAGIDERNRYYVVPLVKELLERAKFPNAPFSEINAGAYHEYVLNEDLYLNALTEISEAFEWYYKAQDIAGVNEMGGRLNLFYFDKQQFRLSLVYGLRTEQIAKEETNLHIWNNLSLTFKLFGQLELALNYSEKSLSNIENRGDSQSKGAALNNLANISFAKGDYDTALRYLEQSLRISQEIGDRKGEGTALNNISQIYDTKGDYKTALRHLEQALKIRQDIGDRMGEGSALKNISHIFKVRGEYDTALRYLEQSLRISQEIGDREGEGTTLNDISEIHHDKGEYDTALRYLEQALKINQDIGRRESEGTVLRNISKIYDAKGDYDRALRYLEQSLKIQQDIGDRKGKGTTLNNIGVIYDIKGDNDTALSYLEQALKIQQEIGDHMGEGATLNNIARINKKRGDYKSALSYYQKSFNIEQNMGDVRGMAIVLWNIGDVYKEQEQYEAAVAFIFQAYQIFERIGSPYAKGSWNSLNVIAEKIGVEKVQQMIDQLNQNK